MWYLITFAMVFLVTLVQTSFLAAFKYLHFIPNLLLIFFVYLAIYEKRGRALIFALVIGFIMDSLSSGTFGLNIAYFTIISLVIGYVRKYVGRSKNLTLALIITFISSLILILFEMSFMLFGRNINMNIVLLATEELAWVLVANLVGAIIFIPLFYRLYIFSKRERDLIHYE